VTAHEESPGNGTAIPALRRDERRAQTNFIGLSALGGVAGFRVNAGAFNPNDSATSVTFFVRDAAGRDLGVVERTWGRRSGSSSTTSSERRAPVPERPPRSSSTRPTALSVRHRCRQPLRRPDMDSPAPEAPRY